MKVKTKISCINSLQEALLVVQEKPDIIEVIVETKSGVDVRSKSKEEAFIILDQVKRKVETCILTDKTEINELQKLLEGLPCDYIFPIFQLHNTVMKKIKIYFPYLKIVPTIHVVDR
ncbi:MAG: hypothetical protein Q7R95_05085, partial [bacterium]|nr:hypothetical protein [bacterium]